MAINEQISIKETILGKIESSPEHSVFFINDFAELGSIETIKKAFQEANQKGLLDHPAHGIYVKPMASRFGVVPIPMEIIAKEIALRDRVQIMPTGYTAANILGLSTQIPMVVSFLTTGSSRTIKVGNRVIKFRHAAPRNFSYKGSTIPLIVQAFKEMGQDNVGEEELSIVSKYMAKASDKHFLAEDALLAPQWIRTKINSIIKHNS